jgi:hypothetical protein
MNSTPMSENKASTLYPEGVYKVRVTAWGWSETGSGNARFWMSFHVLGKADRDNLKADPTPCAPGTGSWSITLASEDNVAWLISNVQSLGYDGHDLRALDPDEPDAFNFEGKEFFASCKHDEYMGRTSEKWSLYKSRKLSKDRFLALNERFGPAVKRKQEQRPANATPAEAPKADAKNVPF